MHTVTCRVLLGEERQAITQPRDEMRIAAELVRLRLQNLQ